MSEIPLVGYSAAVVFNPYNAAIVKEALFSDTIIGRIEIGEGSLKPPFLIR
jgi:hypothetical protein